MTKITPEPLARSAFIYVRQSTADQVFNHHESRRRQYALVDRARVLGWEAVEVIDDDLGRSGSGMARPGFEKLLAAICEGRVGAVVSIEASRLARNGRDGHTLLEFCGLVGTVHLVRRPADRSCCWRRSDRAPPAARGRGGDRGLGGAPPRAVREAASD